MNSNNISIYVYGQNRKTCGRKKMDRVLLAVCCLFLIVMPREGLVSGSTAVSKAQKYYLIHRETPRVSFDPDPMYNPRGTSAETEYHEKAEREFKAYIDRVTPKLDAFIEEIIIAENSKYGIAPYIKAYEPLYSFGNENDRNRRIVVDWGLEVEMTFLKSPSEEIVSELRRKLHGFFTEFDASTKTPEENRDPFEVDPHDANAKKGSEDLRDPFQADPTEIRKLDDFFAGYEANAKKTPVDIRAPLQADPADMRPRRYGLQVEGMDISPASFPGDPEASARNARNIFEGESRRRATDREIAESFYEPLLEQYLSGATGYAKFSHFAGDLNDSASVTFRAMPPPPLFQAPKLVLYFDKKVPLMLRKIVSFQFLAMAGRRADHYRSWDRQVFDDYATEEALKRAIESELDTADSAYGIPFEPHFMAAVARHGGVLEKLSLREPASSPKEVPLKESLARGKSTTRELCVVLAAKIFQNYFSDTQDVPAIIDAIMKIESDHYLHELKQRDALWVIFLGLMEDDDYAIYKNDICNTLKAIPPLRKRWAVSSKNLDWSKVPAGAVLQIDGPNPSTDIMALARSLCAVNPGKTK